MKKLLLPFLLLGIIACEKPAPIHYVIFSGSIDNASQDTIKVLGNQFEKKIPIREDGNFLDTLYLNEKGFYEFHLSGEVSTFFLQNGETVDLSIDEDKFDESIQYSGSLAEHNNLLAQIYLKNEEMSGDLRALFSMKEEAFVTAILNRGEAVKDLINSSSANEEFKALLIKDISYKQTLSLMDYELFHPRIVKDPNFQISESFHSHKVNISMEDEESYRSSTEFRRLASTIFNRQINSQYTDSLGYENTIIKVSEGLENQYIKDEILKENSINLLSTNDKLKSYYDFLMANTVNKSYQEEYTERYEKLKKLSKGMPSPQFTNYENHAGGSTSLSDLKGSYVYIDVWATWCGPCIGEIPSLKALETEYQDKNIQFVSTSIDVAKDHEVWMNMVSNKSLGGIQLMADQAWESAFVKDYEINGIPRFILIDPEGNIVDADAPRPSNPLLKELFTELSI